MWWWDWEHWSWTDHSFQICLAKYFLLSLQSKWACHSRKDWEWSEGYKRKIFVPENLEFENVKQCSHSLTVSNLHIYFPTKLLSDLIICDFEYGRNMSIGIYWLAANFSKWPKILKSCLSMTSILQVDKLILWEDYW